MMSLPIIARLHRLRPVCARMSACIAIVWAGLALPAASQTAPEPFTRVVVTDGSPIQVQSSGTRLVISLDKAGSVTSDALKAQLGARVKNITASADGKQFTVTLNKPFRIRQFVGSKGAGFDVMEDTAPSILPKPATPAPEQRPAPQVRPAAPPKPKADTPKPAPAKPAPVPAPVEKQSVEKKSPAPAPKTSAVSQDKAAPATPTSAATPEAPEEAPVAPAPEPAATEPKVEQQPATPPQKPPVPAKNMTALPIPKEALETALPPAAPEGPQPVAEDPEPKPAPLAPPKKQAITNLVIGVRPQGQGQEINFQWEHRVAASLFQRDRDWWLVFAAPSVFDAAQLRSVLPSNVSLIDTYNLPEYTVLHFVTDGKPTLSTNQRQGSYDWYVSIQPGGAKNPRAYPLEPVTDTPQPYVVVGAFDVAAPLTFTDPKFGDRLMVIPSYEAGKALITPYGAPEFKVIPARQGIVLQLQNEKLTITSGRDGLRISTPNGLKLSKNLPALPMESNAEAANIPNIMFPYARWRVAPEDFAAARMALTDTLSNASRENKPRALYNLATLYLGQGMSEEALSILNQLRDRFPAYYRENEIALLRAAANFMIFRMGDAATDIMSPEIANNPETRLWKDAISLFVPQILAPVPTIEEPAPSKDGKKQAPAITMVTPEPSFDYLAFNPNYIRYYPPKIRQKLAIIAADNFVAQKEFSKAARTLDIINKDGLLAPIRSYAEFLLGRIAADSGKTDQAIKLWTPLTKQYDDMFIHARANFSLAALEYSTEKRSLEDTIKTLDQMRVAWRGDTLEQNLLVYLGELYLENKDYANALRTWKDFVNEYGGSPEGLIITHRMGELFERLFGEEGLADTMDPLRSLPLFYEFRELSPIGARGDAIIQKLADRLAKVDLLDKAAELLEHQVKFRVQGENRARIGAQLALLQILNKNPEKALEALEISGYGISPAPLAAERNRLAAIALSQLGKTDVALEMLANDISERGKALRLEILWDQQDWSNVINVAEDILGERSNIAAPLSAKETEVLLKLALAYSFEADMTQLKYLREYYSPLMKASPYKDIFEHITNDTAVLDPEDFDMVAKQINDTESFLQHFKDKIADGRLSSALEEDAAPTAGKDEPTQSERNSALVPESQTPAATPPAPTPSGEETTPASTSGPQRAPIEVAPDAPPSDAANASENPAQAPE